MSYFATGVTVQAAGGGSKVTVSAVIYDETSNFAGICCFWNDCV